MAPSELASDPAALPPLVEPAAELTKDEVARYSRHLIIPDVGMAGQKRLKNAKVLVVGAGGLGSPALLYLAAAGVGRIGIVDFDVVDASNLQRQVIHGTSSLGLSKLDSAKARILDLNPACQVDLYPVAINAHNALEPVGESLDHIPQIRPRWPARLVHRSRWAARSEYSRAACR